ncbi:hypothetical protein ALC53_14092 [Atta colombica]|uniref:Uncharacterized protein n=1 Tax=Atta colombica TaxID=520822 RepID=A0A195AT75_9HYME|nr:hypothetical protein ALC53_14092 [Atta colombica]
MEDANDTLRTSYLFFLFFYETDKTIIYFRGVRNIEKKISKEDIYSSCQQLRSPNTSKSNKQFQTRALQFPRGDADAIVSIHSLIHSLTQGLTLLMHHTLLFPTSQTRAACAARNAYTADGTRHHRIGEEAWRGTL